MFSNSLLTAAKHLKRFNSQNLKKRNDDVQLEKAPLKISYFHKANPYSDKDFNSLHNSISALEQSQIQFKQQSLIPSKQNYQLSGKYILQSSASQCNSNALKKSKTVPEKKKISKKMIENSIKIPRKEHRMKQKSSLLSNICDKSYVKKGLEKNKKANEIDINSIRNEENQNSSQYQERSDLISYDEFENNARSDSHRNIFELSDPNQKYKLKINCSQCQEIKAKTLDFLNSIVDFQAFQMHKSYPQVNLQSNALRDIYIEENAQTEFSYSQILMKQFLDILRDILIETQHLSEGENLSKFKIKSIQQKFSNDSQFDKSQNSKKSEEIPKKQRDSDFFKNKLIDLYEQIQKLEANYLDQKIKFQKDQDILTDQLIQL